MPSLGYFILCLSLLSFTSECTAPMEEFYDEGTVSTPVSLNFSERNENRIANGRPLSKSDDVHVVLLNITFESGHKIACTGSLLSGDAVLTAAHCVYDAGLPSNRLVSINVTIDSNYRSIRGGQGEVVHMIDTFVHPDFNAVTGEYDVAVIRLERNVSRSKQRRYTPLSRSEPYLDKTGKAKIYGWGRYRRKSRRSNQLLVADRVNVVNIRACKILSFFYYLPRKGKPKVSNANLCVKAAKRRRGEKKQQACKGDSGGPLIRDGELIGIVSWGWSACTGKNLEVFVKISAVWKFINQAAGLGLDGSDNGN